MAWRMDWSWPGQLGNTFRNNFNDGYQFGDVVKSLFGFRDDTGFGSLSDPGNVWNEFGDVFNGLTGTNAANEYNTAQAVASRDFTRQERLDTQDYNSAEALLNRQFTSDEAQKAREWSEMMENTAVQRRMNDLGQAGINPMLVASSGLAAGSNAASGATGSAASVSPGSSASASSAGNSASAVAGLVRAITTLIKAA